MKSQKTTKIEQSIQNWRKEPAKERYGDTKSEKRKKKEKNRYHFKPETS